MGVHFIYSLSHSANGIYLTHACIANVFVFY